MSENIFKDAKARTFLITGASGFIGKTVVEKVLAEGAKVVAADFKVAPRLEELKGDRLDIWKVDLTSDYGGIPQGVTDVIHAAGRVSDWGAYESFYKINVEATKRLAEYSRAAGVKNFLFISSIDIHGFFGHVEETEDGTYYPSECFYPQTKIIAENFVRDFNSDEMKTVCIRPCTVYGPGDTTVQGPIMDAILKGQMGFIDKGKRLISRVYITDLVAGLCRALEFGRGGEAYNIVSGEKINWMEWVSAIAAELGVKTPKFSAPYFVAIALASVMEGAYKLFRVKNPPLLTRMRIQHAGHDFFFLPTKAQNELGFKPEMPWREGVKLMVKEYKERNNIK
ncbi:MAG TPA: NAD-dependent epimerase/dehydratase family protein [Eubacteriales bacterium]|jgi:nucleoside-diphosphate-sugar epimerase|nr:NAD-dependent epimerase/dehydratase family protein [Clostridia bacterium]HRR89642.1 NAD-dependent epimerase/dehydratase family protein [Eubacteriales bacterium]HRU84456.1 NAD-dependent epimerase/dehydratase family protein [Eubacteriales bacterium]